MIRKASTCSTLRLLDAMANQIPLPAELSGTQAERTITIDSALLFILIGALAEASDHWQYTETGALTVEQVRAELQMVLYELIQI